MLKTRVCGVIRKEKLKGGGVPLKAPKQCQGIVIFNPTIDPLLLCGSCRVCGVLHTERLNAHAA